LDEERILLIGEHSWNVRFPGTWNGFQCRVTKGVGFEVRGTVRMYKSIKETQKLFKIEGLERGQVSIRNSKYLLSLSEKDQVKVLTAQLARLKEDLARHETIPSKDTMNKDDDVDKAQLQLLIQVVENLLSQI
jgi:hypothetical protein